MAQKKITELQLRDDVSDDLNFPSDDGIQSYRVTGAQLKDYILAAGNILTGMIGDGQVTLAKLASVVQAALIPTGSVLTFGGSSAPTGFLLCDGSAISRTTYANLYAVIGTTYGVGDGSTTFNLPDTRGIFIRGNGTQTVSGISYSSASLGGKQGDVLQNHAHMTHIATRSGSNQYQTSYDASGSLGAMIYTSGASTDVGNGTPRTGSETRPVNISMNYMIKI